MTAYFQAQEVIGSAKTFQNTLKLFGKQKSTDLKQHYECIMKIEEVIMIFLSGVSFQFPPLKVLSWK